MFVEAGRLMGVLVITEIGFSSLGALLIHMTLHGNLGRQKINSQVLWGENAMSVKCLQVVRTSVLQLLECSSPYYHSGLCHRSDGGEGGPLSSLNH